MAIDIIAKMTLQSDQFCGALERTKGQVTRFGAELERARSQVSRFSGDLRSKCVDANNIFGTLGNAIGKIAPMLGAVTTASEAFNRALKSSQTIGDNFDATMQQVNSVTNQFIYAIANADFSAFSNGIDNLINKAREYQAAYDQLGNTTMSYDYFTNKNMASFQESMLGARDTNKPLEDRIKDLKKMNELYEKQQKHLDVLKQRTLNAFNSKFQNETGTKLTFGLEDLDTIMSYDIDEHGSEEKKRLEARYEEYLKRLDESEDEKLKDIRQQLQNPNFRGNRAEAKQSIESAFEMRNQKIAQEYADAIKYHFGLIRQQDEDLNRDLLQHAAKLDSATRGNASMRISMLEVEKSINNPTTKTNNVGTETPSKIDTTLAEGSIADLENQLKEAQFILTNSADRTVRASFQRTIDYIKRQIEEIKLQAKIDNFDGPEEGLHKASAVTVGDMQSAAHVIEPQQMDLNLRGMENAKLDEGGEQLKNYGDNAQYALQGVQSLAGAMDTLAGCTDDNTAAALRFTSSLISQVAQTIISIATLKADATANMQDAASKTVNAHAWIPFVGVAMGLAGVASIVATMMSLPKFADGGIATKATMGIFGEAGAEAIVPLSKLPQIMAEANKKNNGGVGGSVDFRIKGGDLVGVLRRQDKYIKA